METGLRLDEFNVHVPLRIIRKFTCRMDGEVLFEVKLEPAIATNPHITFQVVARRSGLLTFEWIDTTGAVYSRNARLNVG